MKLLNSFATTGVIVACVLCALAGALIIYISLDPRESAGVVIESDYNNVQPLALSISPSILYNDSLYTENNNMLKNDIEDIILQAVANKKGDYGVSISIPKRNVSDGYRDTDVFYPASISKVPIALLVLRDIDAGKYTLDNTFTLKSYHKAYTSDPMYYYDVGQNVLIREYLELLISRSDNTAMTALEDMLGGYDIVNRRTQQELNIEVLFRYPHQGRPIDVANMFEGIYNQKFLTKVNNDILISWLINIYEPFQDRIPEGLPQNVKSAHKVGQIVTEYGMTYADAGIVYGEEVDYIIVVMNQDVDQEEATVVIRDITNDVYNLLHNKA